MVLYLDACLDEDPGGVLKADVMFSQIRLRRRRPEFAQLVAIILFGIILIVVILPIAK